jgi:large subunit ribosomal protein L13
MSTTFLTVKEAKKEKGWVVVDAAGISLGRLASRIALILRGKHRPNFTQHADSGDYVIVLNVENMRLTGDKLNQKFIKRYSGYPGGLKLLPYKDLMVTHPDKVLRRAVWGMLPRTVLGRRQIRALKIYSGGTHPHQAQMPKSYVTRKGNLVPA